MFENKNILVTGAAGFIGSHLCKYLAQVNPRKILALDSLNYGTWQNLGELKNIELIKADLAELSSDDFLNLMKKTDYVFHLAAEKHNQSKDSPQKVIDVNISATYRLIDSAAKSSIKKFVFTSSLYAYGNMQSSAMKETDIPKPRTIYGTSKLAGEHILNEFAIKNQLDYNVARLFFTYGTHQYCGMGYKSVIVSNFERIIKGERPTIYGDGEQSLDYIYVNDIIEGLTMLASDKSSRSVFNLGSGTAVSVNTLTKLMLKVSGSKLEPLYCDADWTHGSSRGSDPSKAKQELNWQAKVSLEAGLTKVYEWMVANVGK